MASGILEVRLVDAEGIKGKDNLCCLSCLIPWYDVKNPYVLIQYGSQERISSISKGEGKKLVWNEKFRFNVEYSGDHDRTNNKVVFRVMDKHKLSADDFVGETTIYIKDVLLQGMDRGEVELGARKYRVVQLDKTYSGQISVAFTFFKGKDGMDE